jgi:hypothetical protein
LEGLRADPQKPGYMHTNLVCVRTFGTVSTPLDLGCKGEQKHIHIKREWVMGKVRISKIGKTDQKENGLSSLLLTNMHDLDTD